MSKKACVCLINFVYLCLCLLGFSCVSDAAVTKDHATAVSKNSGIAAFQRAARAGWFTAVGILVMMVLFLIMSQFTCCAKKQNKDVLEESERKKAQKKKGKQNKADAEDV
eukprot:Platyproteum_vivax@DN1077_c0_g1_i1.p1